MGRWTWSLSSCTREKLVSRNAHGHKNSWRRGSEMPTTTSNSSITSIRATTSFCGSRERAGVLDGCNSLTLVKNPANLTIRDPYSRWIISSTTAEVLDFVAPAHQNQSNAVMWVNKVPFLMARIRQSNESRPKSSKSKIITVRRTGPKTDKASARLFGTKSSTSQPLSTM